MSTRGTTARNNRGFMPLAACLRLGCFLLAVFLCDALLSEPAFCWCYPRLRFCPARLKRVDLFLASHIVVSCFYKGGALGWVNTKLPIRELVFLRGKQETLDVLFFLAFLFYFLFLTPSFHSCCLERFKYPPSLLAPVPRANFRSCMQRPITRRATKRGIKQQSAAIVLPCTGVEILICPE